MLAAILGHLLSSQDALKAAYLPDGVGVDFARQIVVAANLHRPVSPPFAILVSERPAATPIADSPEMTVNGAIRYRQGNRVAVVIGKRPDLPSFTQVYDEVLGKNFPEKSEGVGGLWAIADLAMTTISRELHFADGAVWNVNLNTQRLENVLALIAAIHRDLGQGTEGWNSYWFRHVDIGLTTLVTTLADLQAKSEISDIDDVLARYTYAAFGLPVPYDNLASGFSGKNFSDAFKNYWADYSTIETSVAVLASNEETEASAIALGTVDWTHFDELLAAKDNVFIAFAESCSAQSAMVEALSGLPDLPFVRPFAMSGESAVITFQDGNDGPLTVAMTGHSDPRAAITTSIDAATLVQTTEEIRVSVPVLKAVDAARLRASNIDLKFGSKLISWSGEWEVGGNGQLVAIGRVSRPTAKGTFTALLKPVKVRLSVPAGDSLFGVIHPKAAGDIYLLPPVDGAVFVFPISSRGLLGKPQFVGPDHFQLEPETVDSPYLHELDASAEAYQYLVWTRLNGTTPELEGTPLTSHGAMTHVYSATPDSADLTVLTIGSIQFEFRNAEAQDKIHSPIVAAAKKQNVTKERPDADLLSSVRGAYETLVSESVSDPAWLRALGHVAAAQDISAPFEKIQPTTSQGFLMADELSEIWPNVSDFEVPDDLISSAPAAAFRQSFEALGMDESLIARSFDGSTFREIPSKISWRHLWSTKRMELEKYLSAYSELIEHARVTSNEAGVFWASYPFSVSVWATEGSFKCVEVLLSPLHPVRLAWLAAVEATLWDSTLAEDLVGTVEGWNFPLFGPSETPTGRMLAVSGEVGIGQLFLGWSTLVAASIDGPQPLVAPERIGSLPAPATAASGLNASAVRAALRSYRRMNPHVSTLTIDLAATSDTNRFSEVDQAVLASVKEWASASDDSLIGGARVWDSTKRAGEPPHDDLTRLVLSSSGTPLSWVRYVPNNKVMVQCNVRVLQDAGVHVAVKTGAQAANGLIGQVPLRRFESGLIQTNNPGESLSSPIVRQTSGWGAFTFALRSVEDASSGPMISSKLFKANLVNQTADWTVSGESMMSPSAMASIVQHTSNGGQMLWEWRPPFLEKSAAMPLLEQRPFVSIARVPSSFRVQIKQLVSKAQGAPAKDDAVDDLLRKLGARGVGLSSLLSMGGTHASGALGFYLSFALMDAIQDPSDVVFVLPIDACDSFLKALALGGKHAANAQRADLLVIRLTKGVLTFAPIEIKFYGLGSESPGGTLPSLDDAALVDPLKQLASTEKLLSDVCAVWNRIRVGTSLADRALWANGLATLVDAAVRLQPNASWDPGALSEMLQSLANGEVRVEAGKPIVCYFMHEASTQDGDYFEADFTGPTSVRPVGLLSANAGYAFKNANDEGSDLAKAWKQLIKWSLSNDEDERVPDRGDGDDDTPDADTGAPYMPSTATLPATIASLGENEIATLSQAEASVEAPALPADDYQESVTGDGVRFNVGRLLGALGTHDADFWPSNTSLNQMNIGVVGDLGTGKTQLLKALVYNLRQTSRAAQPAPVSMLIFDYKRDFQAPEFLEAVGGVVVKPNKIPVNIFAIRGGYTPLAGYQRAQQFTNVLDKIYGNIGPVQRDRLVTSIVQLYKDKGGRPPTLSEVLDAYSRDQKADAVTSILKPFVLGEIFSEDPSEMVSFDQLLNDRVVVVALNDFGSDDNGKNALVVLFLNLYYDYMLGAQKWNYVGTKPQLRRLNSFLLVDEAINIIKYNFPVLMNLMLQGREFGFGVILASQYLDHFRRDGQNYGQPLLTWFIHKVPSVTLKELQQLGLPQLTADVASRIPTLEVHEALYSSMGFSGKFIREYPFYRLVEGDAEQ